MVHVVDLGAGQPHLLRNGFVDHAMHGLGPHIGAHSQHPFQADGDGLLVTSGQQVGQIFQRDAQGADIGHTVVHGHLPRIRSRADR